MMPARIKTAGSRQIFDAVFPIANAAWRHRDSKEANLLVAMQHAMPPAAVERPTAGPDPSSGR